MKPGDKVWIFRGDGLIHQVRIAQIDEYFIWCDNPGKPMIRLSKYYPMFPTREALCEHYRKIFGGIDRKVLLDGINALKKDAKERHEDDCYLHGLYDVMDMINEELG